MGITFLRGQTVGGENNNVEKIVNPDEINIDDDDDDEDEESENEKEAGKFLFCIFLIKYFVSIFSQDTFLRINICQPRFFSP